MARGSTANGERTRFPARRVLAAIVLGLLGSVAVWVATPYNNFILKNGYISDDYLASSVLTMLLFFILVVNPLLRAFRPGWMLDFKQMAMIAGIMFVACTLASSGLLRELPYSLAQQTRVASEWKEVSEHYAKANLPPSLFPGKIGYHQNIDVVRYFLLKLPKGESIPWRAWAVPALSWGIFFIFAWVMLIGMSGMLLPQWRRNERMPFPLTRLLQSLLETPETGRFLPPLFRNGSFWIAAGSVFALYLLLGLNLYHPLRIPAIHTTWDLTRLFTEEPLSYLPGYIKASRVYFIFLGVAFFMSTRVGFSIWFFMVAYALYAMFGQIYAPPFQASSPIEHRTGAMLVIAASVLWLGRAHWVHVFRCLFLGDDKRRRSEGESLRSSSDTEGPPVGGASVGMPKGKLIVLLAVGLALAGVLVGVAKIRAVWVILALAAGALAACLCRPLHSDADRRDRQFGFMFLLGVMGMFGWLVWAGVQVPWALLLVATASMYHLLVSRIVAETGIPILGFYDQHFWQIFSLIPIRLVNAATAWFIGALSALFGDGSRVSLTAMTAQSLGLDEDATPRHQSRLARFFVVVLILGFLGCGAAHLYFSYTHSRTLDSDSEQPISSWGVTRMWPARHLLSQKVHEKWDMPVYNRPAHIAFGAALAAGLQWACLAMPKWPLHPVGLLLAFTWYGQQLWVSVLLGWLLRVAIIFFGGARLYTKARPFFIGLIMGEVFAVIFWSLATGLLALAGESYYVLQILPY